MKDGGPAFPGAAQPNSGLGGYLPVQGMSLRDYFAAKAMATFLLADYAACSGNGAKLASWSYDIADAMLAERDK